MRFNRTEHYYNACREYRAALREIWASYDKEMQRIEQYRGSKGYEKEAAELESKRKEAVSALQAEYSRKSTKAFGKAPGFRKRRRDRQKQKAAAD